MADAVDLRERDFRLRPHRPRVLKDQSKAWSKSFKSLIRLVRMTTRPGRASGAMGRTASRRYRQRCAVRITYSPNRVRGQWAAHGRYIARESATRTRTAKEAGFTAGEEGVDVAGRLAEWQNAGDQRLFKMILSPEFGERIDVQRHARELMARMQRDLGTRLEWVAVAHYNTGHPHVHVALRGRTDAGPLRLERDYIQRGIREHAEDLCTAQLGFRTELDALEAERREVEGLRFTSLDRKVANPRLRSDRRRNHRPRHPNVTTNAGRERAPSPSRIPPPRARQARFRGAIGERAISYRSELRCPPALVGQSQRNTAASTPRSKPFRLTAARESVVIGSVHFRTTIAQLVDSSSVLSMKWSLSISRISPCQILGVL